MAIYHASMKPVSRAAGRSATGAAAYRSAERIVDERTGEVHDYTRRRGVEYAELVGWEGSRAALWNGAEAAETRINSRVARELVIALPSELPQEERVRVARQLAAQLRGRYGVAVDLAVHAPSARGDQRNHHAHLLFTTREVVGGRFGRKTRALDDRTQGPREVVAIRARWAEIANAALARAGVEARIDSRSLEAQGVQREPTQHLGPQATAMERRGLATELGEENRRREREAVAQHVPALGVPAPEPPRAAEPARTPSPTQVSPPAQAAPLAREPEGPAARAAEPPQIPSPAQTPSAVRVSPSAQPPAPAPADPAVEEVRALLVRMEEGEALRGALVWAEHESSLAWQEFRSAGGEGRYQGRRFVAEPDRFDRLLERAYRAPVWARSEFDRMAAAEGFAAAAARVSEDPALLGALRPDEVPWWVRWVRTPGVEEASRAAREAVVVAARIGAARVKAERATEEVFGLRARVGQIPREVEVGRKLRALSEPQRVRLLGEMSLGGLRAAGRAVHALGALGRVARGPTHDRDRDRDRGMDF